MADLSRDPREQIDFQRHAVCNLVAHHSAQSAQKAFEYRDAVDTIHHHRSLLLFGSHPGGRSEHVPEVALVGRSPAHRVRCSVSGDRVVASSRRHGRERQARPIQQMGFGDLSGHVLPRFCYILGGDRVLVRRPVWLQYAAVYGYDYGFDCRENGRAVMWARCAVRHDDGSQLHADRCSACSYLLSH